MPIATYTRNFTYTRPEGDTASVPASTVSVTHALGAQQDGGIDIPDTTAADTVYPVAFGSVASATYLEVKNDTGQDVLVHSEISAETTLVAGQGSVTLPAVPGERLTVELVTSGGTPGVLAAVRNVDDVDVTSYNGSGIETLDTSTVRVIQTIPFRLSDGGALAYALPALPAAGGISAATVTTTATQVGDGACTTRVFGDASS